MATITAARVDIDGEVIDPFLTSEDRAENMNDGDNYVQMPSDNSLPQYYPETIWIGIWNDSSTAETVTLGSSSSGAPDARVTGGILEVTVGAGEFYHLLAGPDLAEGLIDFNEQIEVTVADATSFSFYAIIPPAP